MSGPRDHAVEDLKEVVRVGLARGGALLTAGELVVARTLYAIAGEPGRVYARLSARVGHVFHDRETTVRGVADLRGAVDELVHLGLADRLVPPVARPRLLPATGWFRLTGRSLLARLARFAFQQAFPDRSRLAIERLGIVRWPEYALTTGAPLHRDRGALLAWETLLRPRDLGHVLRALASGAARAPGALDLRRPLRRLVREAAEAEERAGRPDQAVELYARLVDAGERAGRVAFRHARSLEKCGRPRDALAVLRGALVDCLPSEVSAVVRAGRRLARTARGSFPPAAPLRVPTERTIRLHRAIGDRRRRWQTPEGPRAVEDAVASWLAGHGRSALYGEGAPLSTICALLLAELYFLPVAGALPVRTLSGPLDLGTPAFRGARREAWAVLVAAVEAGAAPSIVAAADARWRGVRLTGARWDAADRETLIRATAGIPSAALVLLLERFADEGPRAMSGLPDLAVLPGPTIRLPDTFPAPLPAGLLLAEVKGPGDTLRDTQAVWLDRLAGAGMTVEVWRVQSVST